MTNLQIEQLNLEGFSENYFGFSILQPNLDKPEGCIFINNHQSTICNFFCTWYAFGRLRIADYRLEIADLCLPKMSSQKKQRCHLENENRLTVFMIDSSTVKSAATYIQCNR